MHAAGDPGLRQRARPAREVEVGGRPHPSGRARQRRRLPPGQPGAGGSRLHVHISPPLSVRWRVVPEARKIPPGEREKLERCSRTAQGRGCSCRGGGRGRWWPATGRGGEGRGGGGGSGLVGSGLPAAPRSGPGAPRVLFFFPVCWLVS